MFSNKRVIRQNSVSISELTTTPNMTPPTANVVDDELRSGGPTAVFRPLIVPSGSVPMAIQQPVAVANPLITTPTIINGNIGVGVSVAGGATANVSLPVVVDDSPVSLLTEIADIMRSFGDCDQPRAESVKLIEQILQQQLRGIFNEASLVAMRRKNSPCPSQADFEFLMRLHPVKIARMRKHLKDMRILKRFLSIRTGRPQDFTDESEQPDEDEELAIEVPELYDEERTRRLIRADRISQILTGQQYLEFNEARKTSFYCRHGEKIKNKFRRFLDLPADLRIPMATMNILAYFAHETLAVIVDYAILTRLNTSNRATEPFSRVTAAGGSPSMMHVCPEVTQGRGMEVVKPISVQEIHEAMRRFRQMSSKRIGTYRSSCDVDMRRSFLAI